MFLFATLINHILSLLWSRPAVFTLRSSDIYINYSNRWTYIYILLGFNSRGRTIWNWWFGKLLTSKWFIIDNWCKTNRKWSFQNNYHRATVIFLFLLIIGYYIFYISRKFYAYLIGTKGSRIKQLNNETKTEITIPREKNDKTIVINGPSPSNVISARHKIELISSDLRERHPVTHFLSIPLINDGTKNSLLEFQVIIKAISTNNFLIVLF